MQEHELWRTADERDPNENQAHKLGTLNAPEPPPPRRSLTIALLDFKNVADYGVSVQRVIWEELPHCYNLSTVWKSPKPVTSREQGFRNMEKLPHLYELGIFNLAFDRGGTSDEIHQALRSQDAEAKREAFHTAYSAWTASDLWLRRRSSPRTPYHRGKPADQSILEAEHWLQLHPINVLNWLAYYALGENCPPLRLWRQQSPYFNWTARVVIKQ